MFRILFFLILVFALALGGAWIADRPGAVRIEWLGYAIDTSTTVAVAALIALVAAAIIVYAAVRWFFRTPAVIRQVRERRRRDRGYRALADGLIAAGAGNARQARRHANAAHRMLPDEPAVQLLEAQAAALAGDPEGMRRHFSAMIEAPQTRLLGLHGLYQEARFEGQLEAARHYAEEAAAENSALPWASQAQFEFAAAERDWESATRILDRNVQNRLVDRDAARRLKAVLLTARALELEAPEPEKARKMAIDATRLATDLVPAASVAARLLVRTGNVRRATRILEAAWRKEPHPELAKIYAEVRPGDAAAAKLRRMKTLAALKPGHRESALAVAQAAIEAREFDEARRLMRPVAEDAPTQRACVLMAELEAAEGGSEGRVREWLARAVRAPRDPAWVADGVVSETWQPISPVTGRLDAFEWKAPVDSLGKATGPVIDEALLRTAEPRPVGAGSAGAAGLAAPSVAAGAGASAGAAGTAAAVGGTGGGAGSGGGAAAGAAAGGGATARAPAESPAAGSTGEATTAPDGTASEGAALASAGTPAGAAATHGDGGGPAGGAEADTAEDVESADAKAFRELRSELLATTGGSATASSDEEGDEAIRQHKPASAARPAATDG